MYLIVVKGVQRTALRIPSISSVFLSSSSSPSLESAVVRPATRHSRASSGLRRRCRLDVEASWSRNRSSNQVSEVVQANRRQTDHHR